MNGKPTDIRTLSFSEIEKFFLKSGEKPFRARQVYDWLWRNYCRSFDEMTNISKDIRQLLKDNFSFPAAVIHQEIKSTDGTIKMVFRLDDGQLVEGVLIPADGRTTACISSQVGCALNCSFCATGQGGFSRNLLFHEITDQVILLNQGRMKSLGSTFRTSYTWGWGSLCLITKK